MVSEWSGESPISAGCVGGAGVMGLEQLTRRHGVKVPVGVECSVEECSLAVGAVVGYNAIRSASRMNSAVVLFLDEVEKVNTLVEKGIVLKDSHTAVFPLVSPAKKVTLSNVPPFIKDEVLLRELSRHGQIVSTIHKIPLGCKSPLLQHVVSFRRRVFMILKNDAEELNLALRFRIDNFDYVIFATTETMKCFGCGLEGHLVRSCPGNTAEAPAGLSRAGVAPDGAARVGIMDSHVQDQGEQAGDRGKSDPLTVTEEQGRAEGGRLADMEFSETEQRGASKGKEPVFKRPANRARSSPRAKKSKVNSAVLSFLSGTEGATVSDSEENSASDSERESSDSSIFEKCTSRSGVYSTEQVRRFLRKTKGKRNVKVENYFPDLEVFLQTAKGLIRSVEEGGIGEPEVHRLKKLVLKVRTQLEPTDEVTKD